MANANDLMLACGARVFIVGYPGTAKTSSLASLANAGFKLRILDFDGNLKPLLMGLSDEAKANVDAVYLADEMRDDGKCMQVAGIPTAFNGAAKLMKHWTYTDVRGEVIDLGHSKDWGSDTVVVVDSFTKMGEAAFNRTLKACNRTPLNCTRQIWGSAMKDQQAMLGVIANKRLPYHVVAITHLKLIGPREVEDQDDDVTKDLKAQVADLVPFRLFPWALGKQLSPVIGGDMDTLILAESVEKANSVKRVLVTEPRASMDIKVPARGLPKELPIDTGLLTIFEAMGHKAPGFKPQGAGQPGPLTKETSNV